MRYVKWIFWIIVITVVFSVFHYTLPQHDIVRVVNTYEERQDLNDWTRVFWSDPDDQSTTLVNRDVQFIQAIKANGKTMVYRNEDTGWRWPPYFKFDTANLYTEANDAKSTKDAPEWYSMTHYGWRNEYLSIFPNAVAMKKVAGPDTKIFPWVSLIIILVILFLILMLRRMWAQFRERSIDPVIEDVTEASDAAKSQARGIWGRIMAWLSTWRSKRRK